MISLVIIEVDNLRKKFGSLEAVQGVSFVVHQGEIFAFLGPNGAGKSTTIKILCTLLKPSAGRAMVNGFDVEREPLAVRSSIGIVFQESSLDNYLTAEQNLWYHCMIYHVPPAERKKRIDEALRLVDLEDRRSDLVRFFSGGMKRRLEIVRGLLHRPRVLFLDEPTVGLDPQTRRYVWEHIIQLKERFGTTIFVTTHYMDEAEHADRIAIIDYGRIVALDTPQNLKRNAGGEVIFFAVAEREQALRMVEEKLGLKPATVPEGLQLAVTDVDEILPRLVEVLGRQLRRLEVRRPSLDDVFLQLTGRALRDEGGGRSSGRVGARKGVVASRMGTRN